MKGLDRYIKKYGKHFTLELALRAIPQRWSVDQIEKSLNKRVWYNVTESTLGDIVYLVNLAGSCYDIQIFKSKDSCIKYALSYVGDVNCNGVMFQSWVKLLSVRKKHFDFDEFV